MYKKIYKYSLLTVILAIACFFAFAAKSADQQDLISLFPINHYDQTVSTWINSDDKDYEEPLLTSEMQQKRFDIFYAHYFGSLSPWNAEYVNKILHHTAPDDLKTNEKSLIKYFDNEGKDANEIGYGENFRPHDKNWIEGIANNINLSQFDNLTYQASNRGIVVENSHTRILPTEDVYFYSHKIAGEGYPFDNMQISAVWAGTPVYIIAETRDHTYSMVITPDYIGWVKSSGIARTDNVFVDAYSKAANDNLAAITHTQTSLLDEKGNYLLQAFVGSVFPGKVVADGIQLMVPVANADKYAVIKNTIVAADSAALMPISATPYHFSNIIRTLIGRTYGWGGMYFYNDCSAELKSLLTPFGIWLPRHSSMQVTEGKMVDMSSASANKRLAYLIENGRKFLTIIYTGGHIIMYVGNYPNPDKSGSVMAMTYQNIWGLRPHENSRRAVIGKSVLFPMLLQYPEDSGLMSLADKKYFQVSFLNELPSANLPLQQQAIDLKALMFGDVPYI